MRVLQLAIRAAMLAGCSGEPTPEPEPPPENRPPTINTTILPLGSTEPGKPYVITYEQLLKATGATDPDGDVIRFQITPITGTVKVEPQK